MLGNTITMTLGGAGGTAIVMNLINQDGYASEYFRDDGAGTYRVQIRHSRDKVKAGTQPFDRHSVTFTRTVKPTEANPLGTSTSVSFIIRSDPNEDPATVVLLSDALSYFFDEASDKANKIVGWES